MNVEYAVFCPKGAALALQGELSDLGIISSLGGQEWVRLTTTESGRDIILDRSQAVMHLMALLATGGRDAVEEAIRKLPPSSVSFCVRANGEERQTLQEELGALIKTVTGAPVNLTKPEVTYYAHETDEGMVFGVDKGGSLGKRHYKIITGAQSLTGPVAYCTLRLAGWNPKIDLVVWPAATGELAIEAALAATKRSPRSYERKKLTMEEPTCRIVCADPKLSLVRSAEKNAKVAGIHKAIRFSRQDAEWLDTKYDEKNVQLMVGLLPNLKLYPKLVAEIFYQLDYILARRGTASFLCVNNESAEKIETYSEKYHAKRTYIWAGKHCYTLVTISKGAEKKTGAEKKKKTAKVPLMKNKKASLGNIHHE